MKGIVFNAFEDFVSKGFGSVTHRRILKDAHMEDVVFLESENYEDIKLLNLISISVCLLELSMETTVRTFGEHLFKYLMEKNPQREAMYSSAQGLLLNLDEIIHEKEKVSFDGTETPCFNPQLIQEGEVYLSYVSKVKLCPLVEGLLIGMGQHFDKEIHFEKIPPVSNEVVCHFKVQL